MKTLVGLFGEGFTLQGSGSLEISAYDFGGVEIKTGTEWQLWDGNKYVSAPTMFWDGCTEFVALCE